MPSPGEWVTQGFDSFRLGAFGNAGQNLYVSRAGVLQRIHLFDLNKDGHVDLVFCNSQEQWESPPAYVYSDVLGECRRVELPSDGSPTGAIADLNGNGYDDLVLGMEYNGVRADLNAFIYYGSPDGLTERYHTEVPAPRCTSVAVGDFNGDGRPDLAMVCEGKLRVFHQTELGFEPERFVDLDMSADQLAAHDLDRDGYADLYALAKDQPPRVFWGGPDGLSADRSAEVPITAEGGTMVEETADVSDAEKVGAVAPLARVVALAGVPHLFVPLADRVLLVPVSPDRSFTSPLTFSCPKALSVAVGDVNGDGHDDLVFAARDDSQVHECSWVYWGGDDGYREDSRTPLPSVRACDVAVGDLNGSGCADVALCQNQTAESYSIDSLIYRGTSDGVDPEPVRLPTEGARRVFIARTSDTAHPQVIFVNRFSRSIRGDLSPTIYLGGPDGFSAERRQELSGLGAANALACDLDDDGYPDIVIANSAENAVHLDPGSFVFRGGPDGFASEPSWTLPTKHAWGVASADLRRSGYLDLIVASYATPELLIFRGTEGGLDVEHPQRIPTECDGVSYDQPRRLCLADLNNNGWLDLVVSQTQQDRCFILWGGPDGFSFENRRMLPVMRGSAPMAVDLTGNGYLDLVMAGHKPSIQGPHDSFVYIYWNGPDGLREDRRTQLPANAGLAIAAADFNRDGFLDIFVGSYHDGRSRDTDSFIYWGGPEGFSRKRATRLRTHSVSGCLAADFNEDGWIDLAVCNHKTFGDHRGDSFVFWNGPDGFDPKRVTRLPTTGAHGMIFFQPGNQTDRGPEEYYTSEPVELTPGARPRKITWEAELPPKTWVHAQIRTASTRPGLEQAAWRGRADDAWLEDGDAIPHCSEDEPWVQYRLALGAVNSGNTPRVTRVCIGYA